MNMEPPPVHVCARVGAAERADQQVQIGERGSSRATGAVLYVRMLIVTKGSNRAGVPGGGSPPLSATRPFPFFIPHKLEFLLLPPFIPPSLHALLSLMHFKQLLRRALRRRSTAHSLIAQRGLEPSG